ncbi:hypothetical protein pb186bvf_002856 [Paramecium bursaria]
MGCQSMKSKKCSVVILRDFETCSIQNKRISLEGAYTQGTPQNQKQDQRNTDVDNKYHQEVFQEKDSIIQINSGEQLSKFCQVVANMSPIGQGCIKGSTPKAQSLQQLMKQKQAILEAESSHIDILSQKKLEAKMIRKEQQSQFETLKQIF